MRSPLHAVRAVMATALVCTFAAANAQTTPVGLWRTFSDDGLRVQATVRIVEQGGKLWGRIEHVLDAHADKDERCEACKGRKHGQPMVGLEIIENVHPVSDKGIWRQGTVLDPESGDEYRLEMELREKGRQLILRGYWGPFWRTQVWQRAD